MILLRDELQLDCFGDIMDNESIRFGDKGNDSREEI